jgi:L-arabinose isomerase
MLNDDPVCWNEVDAWIEAARVAHTMFHNRLGLMGHYYGGMLDIYSDTTRRIIARSALVTLLRRQASYLASKWPRFVEANVFSLG